MNDKELLNMKKKPMKEIKSRLNGLIKSKDIKINEIEFMGCTINGKHGIKVELVSGDYALSGSIYKRDKINRLW